MSRPPSLRPSAMTSPTGTEAPAQRSELTTRWIVAAVGIPVVALVIFAGGWVLAAVLAVVAALGAREVYGFARQAGIHPFAGAGALAAGLLVLAAALAGGYRGTAEMGWAVLVALLLGAFGAAVWARGPEGRPLAAVSVTVAGAVYVGGALAFAVLLRELPRAAAGGAGGSGGAAGFQGPEVALTGTLLLVFPIAVSWLGDAAAYFVGRRWGRRKLIPQVSPKKTVEGGVAGLVASVVGAGVYAPLALSGTAFAVPAVAAMAMGLVLGAAAQVGDLAISVLKREAGVKDSGALLPGHGGILDRLDSLFMAIPAAYVLLLAAERGVLG